jgi:hypothetical protein
LIHLGVRVAIQISSRFSGLLVRLFWTRVEFSNGFTPVASLDMVGFDRSQKPIILLAIPAS